LAELRNCGLSAATRMHNTASNVRIPSSFRITPLPAS
jgi:hypothetical protein